MLITPFLFASGLTGLVSAASIKGRIRTGDVLRDVSSRELTASTRVVLDGGRWSARVGKGGEWELQNVGEGDYLLDVISPGYQFDQLLVHVDESSTPSAHPHTPFAPLYPPSPLTLPYPLQLTATSSREFVVKDQGFGGQLRGMIGNPMILMTLGSLAMIFVLPRMLAGMDPEAMKEAQKVMGDAQRNIQSAPEGPARITLEDSPPKPNPSPDKGSVRGAKAKKRR